MASSGQQKKKLKPRGSRLLAFGFLLLGLILGIFDAPHFWNILLDKTASRTGAPFFSYLKIRGPVLFPYRLGLDIQGGAHLVYQADLSNIASADYASSMEAVRDVIERRVNLFGVAEPLVQVEKSGSVVPGLGSAIGGEWRLIVELAGVKDVNAAIRLIGDTPYLEFKEERPKEERGKILEEYNKTKEVKEDPYFISTILTGKHLKRAQLLFDETTYQPQISLELNDDGKGIFAELTKKNIGKQLAIFLDGAPISAPVVREEITEGKALITGDFTPQAAKELVGRLNAGALPVPIKLIAQETVQASLGQESLLKSLNAGVMGFLAVALFMIFWYRLPGLISVLALLFYVAIVLAVFKLIPVTLSAAGIAGFILSVGMAVDANVLIFERLKEELRAGKILVESVHEGFGRAWTSIRDSNVSSLMTSAILYWLGTSVVQGFALTLGVGILFSMLSAIAVTRVLLFAVLSPKMEKMKFVFLSGIFR